MTTKHEQILSYIELLGIGEKISVRQIAKELKVSEGTAYRAIKEAESQGLVSAIERVGTVRIERKQRINFDKLTFAEVINIVDGHVLGGREGLHKTLSKLVIGAMKLEDMMKYVDPGSLLIVGNRDQAHELAMNGGAAVLITGGFDVKETVKRLADEKQLPLISSSYDTFTVASLINRAIYDRMIKKEILVVEDILAPLGVVNFLSLQDTVGDWQNLVTQTRHSRYPVVDQNRKVVGVITSKDVLGQPASTPVEKLMTRHPITTTSQTSVASVAHRMIWEGIELIPVVDSEQKLVGIVSRQDVLKALQMHQKQPQVGETIEDIVRSAFFEERQDGQTFYRCEVTPQMTNSWGMLSNGVLTIMLNEAVFRTLRHYKRSEMLLETVTIYFMKPIALESQVLLRTRVLEISRRFGKVDVEVYVEEQLMGKVLLMAQVWDRS